MKGDRRKLGKKGEPLPRANQGTICASRTRREKSRVTANAAIAVHSRDVDDDGSKPVVATEEDG